MKRLLAILLFLPVMAFGAITRTQNVSAVATNVAITSTAAGDVIITYAYNAGVATIPTLPAGFTSLSSQAGTAQAFNLGYKISPGGDTSSGTWTNANNVVCLVYSGAGSFGTVVNAAGNSTILSYSGVTLQDPTGASVVLGFGGASSVTAGMNASPTGGTVAMTNRANTGAASKVNGCDTALTAANYTTQTLTVTTTGRWLTSTVELKIAITTAKKGSFLSMFIKR